MISGRVGREAREPRVSVIVPFLNAERHFAALLESMVAQSACGGWEVVAVDNGSSDRSRRIAQDFLPRLPLRIVDARNRQCASHARNVGAATSHGQLLLFVDADDQLAPGYVAAMTEALSERDFVTSRVDSVSLNAAWVRAAHGPAWQSETVDRFYGFLPAAGANIGIRRDLFVQLGGFPEEFIASEDIAMCWRARLQVGLEPQFVPAAVYRYRYRDTLRGLLRQSMQWGRASALLYRRFGPYGMPGRAAGPALDEWRSAIGALARARTRTALAPALVRFGYCVGRLIGCARYRVFFP